MFNPDLLEEIQVSESRDHITEAHSALDPIDELAMDNDCSRAEMLDWLDRPRKPQPQPEPSFDASVPF